MTMSVLILLLLAQFTLQLDGAIVRRNSVEECLDGGVIDLAETNPFCASQIDNFLVAARSQPEDFNLPQDVIDGICNITCYSDLSRIYYHCTNITFDVRK